MPLDKDGIFHGPSKKSLIKRDYLTPKRGKISRWSPKKRADFERELTAQQKTIVQIAKDYGVSYQTAIAWKKTVLQPALIAAVQQEDIERQGQAKQYLSFLFDTHREALLGVAKGEPLIDQETGNPVLDEKTGKPVRVYQDAKQHGTTSQLIGQGANLVKMLGELTGEFAEAEKERAPQGPTVIRAIMMPKIGESMPQMGIEVTIPGRSPVQLETGDSD